MKCDLINDIKLFPTVYLGIYCSKFLTLSNQKLCYKANALELSFTRLISKMDLFIQCSPFIMLHLVSTRIDHVISESHSKGIIQKNEL